MFTAKTNIGEWLSQEQCQRMFELRSTVISESIPGNLKENDDNAYKENLSNLITDLKNKDFRYLQHEVNKLNRWAEDRIYLIEKELKDTKLKIRELNHQAALVSDPGEQLDVQKKLRDLEKLQRRQRQQIFDAEDQVKDQRDKMIDQIEKRMQQKVAQKLIFVINWEIN